MVLQQLADGLLLQDVPPPVEEPAKPDQGCDASQTRAVEHRDTPFLLRAGPGTGKTKTLTARIVRLLEQGVAPSGILALTFSNKAAQELTERVQNAAGPTAVNIWTGTFHAFGLDTIRRHHALFGVSDVAAIEQTAVKYAKRVTDCETAIADIRRGRFDPVANDLNCPRCAFLFVCATPEGQTLA